MNKLLFLDKGHRYLLDGAELPSVSHLCRFLHREIYSDAPPWQMEAAAQRGTAVHAAAEELDRHGSAQVDGELLPYLQAYAAFRAEHAVSWDLIEHAAYHPEDLYAGTIDRWGTLDGLHALVDLKTTYSVYKPLCSAQLNLYRRILQSRGLPVDRLYILRLKKDGTYRLIPFDFDDLMPNALIALHNALRRKRKRR